MTQRFWTRWWTFLSVIAGLSFVRLLAQEPSALKQPDWGSITAQTNIGAFVLTVRQWPADGKLMVPSAFPEITGAFLENDRSTEFLAWRHDGNGSASYIEVPTNAPSNLPVSIRTETAQATTQYANGRITFSARDGKIEGPNAKLESDGGFSRIISSSGLKEPVTWNYKPTRWGMYDVEVSFAAEGENANAAIAVEIVGEKLQAPRPPTGSLNRFQTLKVGRFYLAKSDPFTVKVSCPNASESSKVALKSVTLRPAPEGKPIEQEASGLITLHARDALTHSVTMRYEPATNKNCLGFWVNPNDWAEWEFLVKTPGTFEVEIWQGCGKGHGGSDVAVEIGDQRFVFVVEETGHFQSFLPRKLGRVKLTKPGNHALAVKPVRKQGGAVLDIRQLRLIPVSSDKRGAAPSIEPFLRARRIAFLGDSITYGGEYVEFVEAWFRMNHPTPIAEFINLGLPSETVSGLSEPGHAGGAFPRPDLHERLGRILEQVKPDLIVACYGMNDGIYYPLGDERLQKFQDGIRRLRDQAAAAGAQVIHLTPPVFDPVPLKGRTLPAGLSEYKTPFEGYNTVLDHYANWLVSQRANGWTVVDIHNPMNQFLADRRRDQPQFLLAGDGVHANVQGHWLMARELLRYLGASNDITAAEKHDVLFDSHPDAAAILKLVQQRQRLMRDAWLTRVGHKRPGMSKGKPFDQADAEGASLDFKIYSLADIQFPGKRSLWHGFERFDFEVDGKPVLVVAPKKEAPGRPWVWYGEFFGHKPNPDLALLGRGFHVVYMSVPDMLGSPEAVRHWNAFYRELTHRYNFAQKAALVGLSRGGLYAYNWAAANPEKVACIYGDAPVCDFKSWPGGKGKGPGSERDWKLVLERHGFDSEAEALAYAKNPIDNLKPLADARVPLLHVFGDADEVVPWEENTGLLAERYEKLGGKITLIRKPGVKHHPHGLEDSSPIVDFILRNTANDQAQAWLAKHGGGPLDANERPLIRKFGTIDLDLVETTPVVFSNRVWRFEWVRQGLGQQYWGNERRTNHFRFRDPSSGEVTAPFADGHEFGSAFVYGDTVYVTGTLGRSQVNMFSSRDLKNWESWPVIQDKRYGIFNTSICRAENDFVLMFEIDKPAEEAGAPFTARFARSSDLKQWTITPAECNYAKDRYTAPHALRWLDGWYYNFYLEAHEGYEMRVVRSRDLVHWETSQLNPVLKASQSDKVIANPKMPDQHRTRVANAVNLNNSDIDFCEWQGRLLINYSWGNQQGMEHLAEAVYDGSLEQFLRGWFPKL